MSLRGGVRGYRDREMKTFIERYCTNCRNFIPEERDGSLSTFDPSELAIPDFAIDKFTPGCQPYEVRVCDATYVPDGKGGCKAYVEGRLLVMLGRIGTFESRPIEKSKRLSA